MAIQLKYSTFTRAAEKARSVHPRVTHSGAAYLVARSDGGLALVRFSARSGAIWATCDCPAGVGLHRRGWPLPCYHVAAALLFGGSSAPAPSPETTTPDPVHSHLCPRCDDLFACHCPGCAAIDCLPCDACDQAEADALTWAGLYAA